MAGSKEWSDLEIATGEGPWRGLPREGRPFTAPEWKPPKEPTLKERLELVTGVPGWRGLPRRR